MSDSTTVNKMPSGRIPYLDILRVIAIISVILNHAVSRTFHVYEGTAMEYENLATGLIVVKVVCYIFSRLGVPLFLMITGALLLRKDFSSDEKVSGFFRHNWLSLFVTTEIWLTIMYWYLSLGASSPLRAEGMLSAFAHFISTLCFTNQFTMGSMWYMPMILCLYLLVPAVALVVKHFNRKYVLLPVVLVVLFGICVPNVNMTLALLRIEQRVDPAIGSAYLFSVYLAYMILGYYLSECLLAKIPTAIIILGTVVSFAATCTYQLFAYTTGLDYAIVYDFIGVAVCATFLFEWIRRAKPLPESVNRLVCKLSQIAFGIYFVHICIMTGLDVVLDRLSVPYVPQLILLELVSFVGSVLIILPLSKIPFCKRYLFLIKD